MPRFKRAMAVCAALASVAAVSAAPAMASETSDVSEEVIRVCNGPITLPGCVDYVFDTAQDGVDYGRYTWNQAAAIGDNVVCQAHYILTEQECPSELAVPRL